MLNIKTYGNVKFISYVNVKLITRRFKGYGHFDMFWSTFSHWSYYKDQPQINYNPGKGPEDKIDDAIGMTSQKHAGQINNMVNINMTWDVTQQNKSTCVNPKHALPTSPRPQ